MDRINNGLGASPTAEPVPVSSADAASFPSAEQFIAILRKGYWAASVYHMPPNRKYPRGGIMCGTSIFLPGKYASDTEALNAARKAIAAGRVDIGTFIHGPSATPYARFQIDQKHIEEMAILASAIEARREETGTGSVHESAIGKPGRNPWGRKGRPVENHHDASN